MEECVATSERTPCGLSIAVAGSRVSLTLTSAIPRRRAGRVQLAAVGERAGQCGVARARLKLEPVDSRRCGERSAQTCK